MLTALQLTLSWQANRTAAADTTQLVRVQGIKTSLLRADAIATNAFLSGGLEPADQRAAYDDAIDQTGWAITDAADAQPAETVPPSTHSAAPSSTTRATWSRPEANNRQGLPVGSGYLRKASDELRSTAMPIADELVIASLNRSRRADDQRRRSRRGLSCRA